MKTISDSGKYRAMHTAKIDLPKEYKDKLLKSGDDDFVKLAKMDGERVAIISFPQPLVDRDEFKVGIFEPFEGMIKKKYLSDLKMIGA